MQNVGSGGGGVSTLIDERYNSDPPNSETFTANRSGTCKLWVLALNANYKPTVTLNSTAVTSVDNAHTTYDYLDYYEVAVNSGDTIVISRGNETTRWEIGLIE